eukprot:GFUD01017347.1.p1 GENE.GFUD01017347.1~~GFUD01017347.1.p1  ORF type:complete len:137 (+),score=46.36 GFUD01017347.1:94-504(+)
MEKYFGTWNFVESSNFEEYLKGLGISFPLRKLAGLSSPTISIKQEIGGRYSVTTDAMVCSASATFQLGELIQERTVDLRTVSSTFSLDQENDCLVLTSTGRNGLTSVDTRTVKGDLMQVVMVVKGITATATFRRKA